MKLYYEVRGNGPRVFFITGAGGDARAFTYVADP
jgi:hypothetical protein